MEERNVPFNLKGGTVIKDKKWWEGVTANRKDSWEVRWGSEKGIFKGVEGTSPEEKKTGELTKDENGT